MTKHGAILHVSFDGIKTEDYLQMINILENTQLISVIRVHDDYREIGNLLWSKENLGVVEFNRSESYPAVAQKVADKLAEVKGLEKINYDQLQFYNSSKIIIPYCEML